MSRRAARRSLREPSGVFSVALLGSVALWGRLWVTSPSTRGVCGCGDPALFQWFLAWPAHAIATGHSLAFSRDLFHPAGINLLANTSVLALGVPLSPVTWLGGPVLTENVALLLAVPVAALGMDLLLRRVSASPLARVVLSLLWGFSPFVVANLADSHLMLAWVGVLPLLVLGAWDAVADDVRRARRGQVLLGCALVVQFFLSTELLVLALLFGVVTGVVVVLDGALCALATRRASDLATLRRAAVRLGVPVVAGVVVVAAPAAYALFGPRSLKGTVWGTGFNTVTGGSSILDLVRPHAAAGLTGLSGYAGTPVLQSQLVGWGLLVVALGVAVWRFADRVVRTAAIVALAALACSLTSYRQGWAPWRFFGMLPVLQDVVQLRVAVFALLAAILVAARGLDALGRVRLPARVPSSALVSGVLALAVLPVAIPELATLPLHTVRVAVPSWWRAAPAHGVVLTYPFPGTLLQAPLSWQAAAAFSVALVGGSGPQGTPARAGADRTAISLLDDLSSPYPFGGRRPPSASPGTAAPVRAMLARDGVTEIVVPVTIRGGFLVAGRPSTQAAAFFAQVLGERPTVVRDAWVFDVAGPLAAPRFVAPAAATRCDARADALGPGALGPCLAAAVPT